MNLFEFILDPTDMVMPRTPRKLCAWIEGEPSTLSQRAEAKAYARSGQRYRKGFGKRSAHLWWTAASTASLVSVRRSSGNARSRKDYYSMLLGGDGYPLHRADMTR